MPVYSHSIQSGPSDFNGNVNLNEASDVLNTGGFVSSEDAPAPEGTVHAIDGKTGVPKAVMNLSDLKDDDMVVISGIPMHVFRAKELGFDLSGTAQSSATPSPEGALRLDTPDEVREPAPEVDLPDPHTTHVETITFSSMTDSIAYQTGLEPAEVEEMGRQIWMGEVPDDDPVWNELAQRGLARESAHAAVERVADISRKAAERELGGDRYRELETAAAMNPEVAKLVMQHAIKRMRREARLSWTQVADLVDQYTTRR